MRFMASCSPLLATPLPLRRADSDTAHPTRGSSFAAAPRPTLSRSPDLAGPGDDPREVVIGISPGFGVRLHKTTGGVPLYKVLAALLEGVREGGGLPRVVRVRHTADTSFLGLTAARLAGSGVGIGIQGKGTTVIHRHDQAPHMNLELFSQAPLIGEADYRTIGRNAARYALGQAPVPVTIPYRGQALGARPRSSKFQSHTAEPSARGTGRPGPDPGRE